MRCQQSSQKNNRLTHHRRLGGCRRGAPLAILTLALIPCHAGTLYVSAFLNNTITSYDSAGNGTVFGGGTGFGFGYAGLARDAAGNLYVADAFSNTIVEFAPNGSSSTFANSGLSNPLGLAFDGSGNLYAANQNTGTIEEFTPAGAGSVFATGLGTGGFGPTGLAFDNSGNLYVSAGFLIDKITPGGSISTFFTAPGMVNGLAFDTSGNLYAALGNTNTIEKITSGGSGSTFASTGLNSPEFMAFDNLGNLFVANNASNTVEEFAPNGSASQFATTAGNPEGVLFVPSPEPSTWMTLLIGGVLTAAAAVKRCKLSRRV